MILKQADTMSSSRT